MTHIYFVVLLKVSKSFEEKKTLGNSIVTCHSTLPFGHYHFLRPDAYNESLYWVKIWKCCANYYHFSVLLPSGHHHNQRPDAYNSHIW